MTKSKIVSIIIPAHNEERVISEVIHKIKKHGHYNVIVIDDGSEDKTYIKAKQTKAIVLRHILRRGKGAAIKTGIEAVKILGADIIVTMDGDGQHDPGDIAKLVNKIIAGYDVVLGSRLINNKGMPFIKIIANYLGNFFTWLMYGIWVSDSQSGFRAYSKKAFQVIDTKHDQYEYDSEIIREISHHNLKYCEVAIKVKYTQYSMGKLHKQSFTNGIKTLARMVISS
jgi:glycosyltransferase involved in cell wall biosynthesis